MINAMAEDPIHIRVRDVAWDTGGPINLEVGKGEFFSVVGPAGSGKSNLVKMLAGLRRPSAGEISISERRVESPVGEQGFVFPEPALLPWRTLLGNVMLQAEMRRLDTREFDRRARHLLAALGLAGFEDRRPFEVAPSAQQRVSLCRALLHDPPLLILDDPFRHLDPLARERLMMDFQHLWLSSRRTVVLATQNIREAVQLSDRVAVLSPPPAKVAGIFSIALARPRRLDKSTTPLLAEYSNRIRTLFHAQGVLP